MTQEELALSLRKLAKTSYYQTVYSFSKESSVWIFKNRDDFSEMQIVFLMYVSFYHSIQMDVYMGEVTERVFDHVIYEDAYCAYRNYKRKHKEDKHNSDSTKKLTNTKNKIEEKTSFQWRFPKKSM